MSFINSKHSVRGRVALMAMTSVAAVVAATPSYAQTAPAAAPQVAESADGSQDIIVTAQKRAQRLIDVPAAVTAVSADILANQQITTAAGLDRISSSVTLRQGTGPNTGDIRIRGVGTSVFSAGVEPSVSFVIDGVVQARQTQGFGDLADIERIEILRGPQGTLFGKNATGGVINLVTARPSKELEGKVDFTIAEQDEYRVKGTISGPVSDTIGVRLGGYYNDVGGHIRNTTVQRDINGYKSYGLRGKVEWDVTPDFNILVSGDWSKIDAECCSLVYVKVQNSDLARLLAPTVGGVNNRETPGNRPVNSISEQWQAAVEANLDLGPVALTSITAYQHYDSSAGGDVDGLNTPTPLFLTAAVGQLDFNDGSSLIRQFSQEVRLASNGSGPVKFVAGLFYSDLDYDSTFFRRVGSCTPGGANGPLTVGQACAVPTYRSSGLATNVKTENYAAFGQVEWNLIGDLTAIGGIRAQHENNSYSGTRSSPVLPGDLLLNAPQSGSGNTSDEAVTGKVGLQYRFGRNAQAYATWSRGYKGAAYAVQLAANFVDQQPVRPETVKSWEGGFKFQTEDRTFGLDVSAFHQRYTDLQVQANRTDLSGPAPVINNVLTNAGSATVKGVEIEAVIRPVQQFTVRVGATIMDSSLNVDGLNCPLQLQAAAPVIPGTAQPANTCYRLTAGGATQQNVRDGKLPNAPDYRLNLSGRYEDEIPGTGLSGFVQVTASYQSDYNFAIEQDPNQLQDGYVIVDASVGLATIDKRYKLTVFAKNLFNQHYLGFVGNASVLTSATLTPNNLYGIVPKDANRYFGATLSAAF